MKLLTIAVTNMKPQTYWVVCRPTEDNPLNDIQYYTLRPTRKDSIYKFTDVKYYWQDVRKDGWRCVKVNLTAI